MALGFRYHSGSTVPKNCEYGLHYYRQVAETGQYRPQGGPSLVLPLIFFLNPILHL